MRQLNTPSDFEIIIPPDTESQIHQSAHRILHQIQDFQPDLILTLERTGSLAFKAIQAAADAQGFPMPPIADVDVSRSISYRFDQQYPRADLSSGHLTDTTIDQYRQWLENDPQATETITSLREELRGLQPGGRITVIDDTKQFGVTLAITGSAMIAASLSPNHQPEFRSSHEQIQSTARRISHPDDQQQSDTISVNLDFVSPDPDWLEKIIKTSFDPYLFSFLPPGEYEVALQFLAHMATGLIRGVHGELQPITPYNMEKFGHRIALSRMRDQINSGIYAAHIPIRNPAGILKKKFGQQNLSNLSDQISQRIYQIGLFAE